MSNLPKDWASVQLADVADVQLGKMLDKLKNKGRPTPYLRNVNVRWGTFDLGDILEMRMSDVERQTFDIRDGDLLVCEGGEPGRAAVWSGGSTALTFQKALMRVRSNGGAEPKYLAAYLRSAALAGELERHFTGTTIKHLPQNVLRQLALPLPPIAEQRRIVAKLDALAARTARVRADLDHIPTLAARYKQAVLRQAVGGALTAEWRRCEAGESLAEWRFVRWDDAGRTISGRAFPSSAYAETGLHLMRPGNLHSSGEIVWNDRNTARMPESWASKSPDLLFSGERILINLTAQSLKDDFLGRACISGKDDIFLLNQRIAIFEPHDMHLRYCLYVLKSPLFREFVADGLNAGSLIQHIHTKQLRNFVFPIPPLAEQAEIIRRVDHAFAEMDRLLAEAAAARRLLERLDQQILAKAFRGELVPQDPADEPASVMLERIRAARTTAPARSGRGLRAKAA